MSGRKKTAVGILAMLLLFVGMTGLSAESITLKIRESDTIPIPGIQDNDVANAIEKKLGIKIDYSVWDKAKDQVALASGDLPDIMQIETVDLPTYINGGNIISLEDLIKTKGKDILANSAKSVAFSRQYASAGKNTLYGIYTGIDVNAVNTPAYNYAIGLSLRWDYYKELGYPAINNEDDYLKVLAAMQKKHPKTDDGLRVYGISGWADWGLWAYYVPYVFSNGSMNGSNYTTVDLKGNVTPMFTDKGGVFKNAMKFLNKANALGLVDPEMFTMKNDQWQAKFKNLQLLSNPANWWNGDVVKAMTAAGIKDAGYYIVPGSMPMQWQGYGSALAGNTPTRILVISKTCKNPDKAMELINYLFTFEGARLAHSGVQDVHWSLVNGKPEIKDETFAASKSDAEFNRKSGIGIYNNMIGLGYNSRAKSGNFLGLSNTDKAIKMGVSEGDKDFNAKYGVDYPGQAFVKLAEKKKISIGYFDLTYQNLYEEKSSDLKLIDGKINDYSMSFAAKLALAKPADFESVWTTGVKEMKAMGLDTLYAWELAQNKKALAQLASLK
ncbi:MAG: hypothetical protein WCQ44_03820 [Opitutaceae bacterium]